MTNKVYVAFGTYETGNNVFLYSYENSKFTHCLSFNAGIRPSYVLFGLNNLLYVVNECNLGMHNKLGSVRTYKISNEYNSVELLSEISSEGEDPCSLNLSLDNKYLLVTNYSSGSVLIYSLDDDGLIEGVKQRLYFKGSGPVEDRQACSHPHSSYFNKSGDTLYIADLGSDCINLYAWNSNSTKLVAQSKDLIPLNKGDGPRMVCLSEDQNILYVVNELSNMVRLFDTKSMKEISSESTIEDGLTFSSAAHIMLKDDHLFVSNRGNDSIMVFGRNAKEWYPSEGKNPRYFSFINDKLFILNQDGGNVCSYLFKDGLLVNFKQELDIPFPTCMQVK